MDLQENNLNKENGSSDKHQSKAKQINGMIKLAKVTRDGKAVVRISPLSVG